MKKKYNYNSLLLDWLGSLVNYKFVHAFSDNWIHYHIWEGEINISLDFRQATHQELFDLLPLKHKGCIQYGTGKLVNEKILYFQLEDIFPVHYPDIIGSKLVYKEKHQSTEHGWTLVSEYFYTYNWEVYLSDGTFIPFCSQEEKMSLLKGDYIYNVRVQEREFKKFLEIFKFE